ncbi:SAM-dependent methyltransferase [Lacticaseibacillus jixiensis]|uniref:SAM-dependent methyltransferase n=1 Tax=Lacticaseibacillus jixiensis TaxID=3231926 RepID=UPI0036F1D76F
MDYWQTLTTLDARLALNGVHQQVTAMAAWRQALGESLVPKQPLMRLGVDESLYLEGLLQGITPKDLHTVDALLRNFRQYCAYHFGMWAAVNQQLFATWTRLFGPLRYLEVAAGNGYVSAGLQAAGNAVITTDPLSWTKENATGRKPLVPVLPYTATTALWRYGSQVDAVVMAWSPDRDPNDAHFLQVLRQHYPNLLFFVIGERNGATNSRLFWSQAQFVPERRLLALNRAFPQYDAINERIYLMR